MSASPESLIFAFGVFEVDRTTHELRRQGRRVRLQQQPFQVLELLLERAGAVVTRDELQSRLWPGKRYGDFDHGLNNAIARLREVLGDDAAAPHFIETVPRRGYRFIYPLKHSGSEAGPESFPNGSMAVAPGTGSGGPVAGGHVVYRLGDFLLDATRRLLYRSLTPNDPVQVKPKVVEALIYLVEHRGELLDKDRLMAELWPGLVVEENSLAQLMSALRRALGEKPGENRYIATVPGRGYRFVGHVARLPETIERRADGWSAPVTVDPPKRSRYLRLIAFGALGAALAVLLAVYVGRTVEPDTHSPFSWAGAHRPTVVEPSPRAVAVLPFDNLTPEGNNDYLASGLAESVLHRLAGIRGLTVISGTSSFGYGQVAPDLRRALNARYLIEGSVRSAGRRLRVTAQLVDVTTGAHVWSLRFDRTIDDIFAVEDDIASKVANALEVSLKEQEHPYARFGTEAYLAFLEGGALINTRKIADTERAIEIFSRAIALAPDFAAAYVALANAHRHLGYLRSQGPGRSPLGPPIPGPWGEALAAGARMAAPILAKAMELDDEIGEAYVLRADLKVIAQDWAGAELDYYRGLELSPGYGAGYEHLAEFLERQGRDEEARAALDTAMRLNPLNPWNPYYKGFMYLLSEKTGKIGEEAERYFLEALRLAPDFHPALMRLAVIRWHRGQFAEAVLLGERALGLDPRSNWMRWFLVEFYLELGEVDAARAVLLDAADPVAPTQWVAICLHQRQPERAVSLLSLDPTSRTFLDHDIEAYVYRDAALATGDLSGTGDTPIPGRPGEYDPFRMLVLAHLSTLLGNRGEAERLARGVLDYQDEHSRSSITYRLTYPKAAAHTLLGERDAALVLLETGAARGFHKRWWYAFEFDPVFEDLRSHRRFQALAAEARAHALEQQQLLEHMRRRGDVPLRVVQTTSRVVC